MTLLYDDNGNLTDDGVFKYVYDGWNRLMSVARKNSNTAIAAYAYDGANRRCSKVVSNCGIENTPGDGGNTTLHYYYDSQWRIVETRNGSNQTVAQWLYGTQYVDELVLMDVSGDPSRNNDADPDTTAAGGETSPTESPVDTRYFYHQDRNWNVVALSHYGGGKNAEIVERYTYTPYGEFSVQVAGGTESGRLLPCSTVGNSFAHQGLPCDAEKRSYQNRHREYAADQQRFAQRDRRNFIAHSYLYATNCPTNDSDATGEMSVAECQAGVQTAITKNKKGRTLIKNAGGPVPECIACGAPGSPCAPNAGGCTQQSGQTYICADNLNTINDVIIVTIHELTHSYDILVRGWPLDTDSSTDSQCRLRACSEIRAYDNDGRCATLWGAGYRQCVIDNAKKSIEASGCPDQTVEDMYAKCSSDHAGL